MTVHRYILRDFSLNYVTARYPFAPRDLAHQAERDLQSPPLDDAFALPIVLDMRMIDLLAYSTDDFKLLLSKRRSLDVVCPAPPCAYVVRDEGSYGMLRVFTSFADARGFRSERLTLITQDLVEAVDWIYPQLEAPARTPLDLLTRIDRLTVQIDGQAQVACGQ